MASPVPGPRGIPWIGSPWVIGRDPTRGLPRLVERFGDVVRFRIAGRDVVLLANPVDVEQVLTRHADKTVKDDVTHQLSAVLGQGLLTSEGAFWKRQRRSIAPAFQPRHLTGYAATMVEESIRHLAPLEGRLDFHHVTTALTLDILVRTVFGEEPGVVGERIDSLMGTLMRAFVTEQRTFWRIVPEWVPATHRRQVEEARDAIDAMIHELVARARAREVPGDDLLGRLIEARDDADRGMTDAELRDELVTLMLAGHETTAVSLAFIGWLLAEHPEIQARAQAEVDGLGGPPTLKDIDRLPLIGAIVDEALRLYPPAWAVARQATEDIVLAGLTIPEETRIVMSPWLCHRDARYWRGPDRFRPDRWLERETEGLPRMAYFPFGGGRRICVGNHFARMELVLALAVLLQHQQLDAVPGFAPKLVPAVTLRPTTGMQLQLTPRR